MYPVIPEMNYTDETVTLSTDEEAALSYVGGYLVRALLKKVERRQLNNKEKLTEALRNFKETPEDEDSINDDETNKMDWLSMYCMIEVAFSIQEQSSIIFFSPWKLW